MTRPTPIVLPSGIASWDSLINKNFEMLNTEPFPLYTVASFGALPDATLYENCVALVVESATKRYMVSSDGVVWKILQVAGYVDPSTAVDLATTITLVNDLIGSMQTGGLMDES